MTNEQRLFEDIDKVAPLVPVAERLAAFQRSFQRVGLKNTLEDVQAAPLVNERVTAIAKTGGSIVMHGVEVSAKQLGISGEA